MKKIILMLIAVSLFSCSKDDSKKNKGRNIAITDIGFEYNVSYKVQHLVFTKYPDMDYVDYSPNIYIVFLNSTDIKETNQYGTVTNKYSLNSPPTSSFPDPQNYISYDIDFIQKGSTSIKTFVISPQLGCMIYKEKGELSLTKDVAPSYYNGFRFIKQ